MAEFNLGRAIRGASLGLATAANALSAAKVRALQAKTQQQQLEAQRQLEQARIDVNRELIASRERQTTAQLQTSKDIAEQNRLVEERIKKLDLAGRLDQIEANLAGQAGIVRTQTEAQKDITQTEQAGLTTRQSDALAARSQDLDKTLTSQEKQTQIQADTTLGVADIGKEATLGAARIGANVEIRRINSTADIEASKIDVNREALRVEQEKNMMTHGRFGGTLSPQALDSKRKLSADLRVDPDYKEMFEVRAGYETAIGGFQTDSGFGDIAMVNGYQRIVDPGVSVRGEDVKVLADAVGFVERLFNIPGRVLDGDRFRSEVREKLREAILIQYGNRSSRFNSTTKARFEKAIELDPFLQGRITYDDIGSSFDLPTAAPSGTSPAPAVTRVTRFDASTEARLVDHLRELVRSGEDQSAVLQRSFERLKGKGADEDYIIELHERAFP
jgi:hypothetical protein